MKYLLSIAAVLFFCTGAHADFRPRVVDMELTKAYIPIGFDDNDNVQVMVTGLFNNTCYRVGPATAHVDEVTKTIQIHQTAYDYGFECLQIELPFAEVVNVGIVTDGNWTVQDSVSGKRLGGLPIMRAKSAAPDDFLYAPISDAFITKKTGTDIFQLHLEGQFPTTCSRIKEIMVHYYQDVIVVQPVMEQSEAALENDCKGASIRFDHIVDLKAGLKGNYLLHVRSLNGQAVNKLVNLL